MLRRIEAGRLETDAEYRGEVSRGHNRNGQGVEPLNAVSKARTVPREGIEREGIEREEKLLAKEEHYCIRRVPRAQACGLE